MEGMKIEINSKSKGIVKRNMDYIIICSLIELGALSYSLEVIKALAVVLRSRVIKKIKNSNYYTREDGVITIDEELYEKLSAKEREIALKALEETSGIIAVSGEGAVDFYCTPCCEGGTANSEDVLGYRLNYLRRVLCRYCGECHSEKIIGIDEIKSKAEGKGIVYKEGIENVLRDVKRDETGRIIEVNVFGSPMTGEEFMRLFELDSNRVYFTEEAIRFKSIGKGLGLGICLKGAEALALSGASYRDIINYYYTGVEFKSINENNIQKLLADRFFIIDAGHGGSDKGNICNGVVEKEVNFAVSLYLKELLEEVGARVLMTRKSDEELALGERVKLINRERPGFFISIHQNSFASPGVNGAEAYCYLGDKEAVKLGELILGSLNNRVGIKNRGVRLGDYYLLRETRVSGVLLETMYLMGNVDIERFNEENYREIARAIFEGICSYYNIEL